LSTLAIGLISGLGVVDPFRNPSRSATAATAFALCRADRDLARGGKPQRIAVLALVARADMEIVESDRRRSSGSAAAVA
jgi:hypothetical protein